MKTKEEVRANQKELRKIWVEFHEDLTLREIFDEEMSEFFDSAGGTDFKSVEWLTLVSFAAKWTRELKKAKKKERREEVKGQSVEDIQDGNRDRMILLLRSILNQYEDEPKALKNISLSDVKSLYKIVQDLEEVKKKTEIERGKLKLDAIKTVLPYGRLKPEALEALQTKLIGSFNRIRDFEEGKLVTPKIIEPTDEELA